MQSIWALSLSLHAVAVAATYPACTKEFIQQIAGNLGDHCSTNCPDATWKERFVMSDTIQKSTGRVVIFDVGCNKALDSLSAISMYSQDYSTSKKAWFKQGGWINCGSCNQCEGEPPRFRGAKKKPVDLYCFEPLPSNYVRLAAASQKFKMAKRGMRTIFAAMTSVQDALARNWTSVFPSPTDNTFENWGHEAFGIDVRWPCPDCPTVPVTTYAVDPFVVAHGIKHIDILSIDTEGSDALVLEGSEHILPNVRYVEFEYHDVGPWGQKNLDSVVKRLEQFGFVCYWIGKQKVWRISDCWHENYNRHCWSNIGCVQQESEWYGIMEDVFNATVPH